MLGDVEIARRVGYTVIAFCDREQFLRAIREDRPRAVFTHCNDCGRKLHTPEEDQIGLCALCANL